MRSSSHTRIMGGASRALTFVAATVVTAATVTTTAAGQGRYDNRGGYDNRGSYDDRGGYGNRGGYDNGQGYGRGGSGARALFVWNGRVDREAYIVMQNGDVRTRIDGSDNGAGGRARIGSALPQADGVIDVRVQEGRGRVDVVEQPTGRNGYRAVIRVRDDDAGAGFYRLVASWRPSGNSGYANGGYGNGGDDRDGRGRERDRDGDRERDRDGRYGTNGTYGNGTYGNGTYGNGTYGSGTYGNRGPNGSYGGSGALHWRGRVDDVEEIRLQGGRVDTRTVSGGGADGVRTEFSGGTLPTRDVMVRVNGRAGRGRVTVVQQPHAANGYTAVVRIEDRDAGASWYDFDVSW